MILEIDIGNSRIKWRIIESVGMVLISHGTAISLNELDTAIESMLLIQEVRVACVKNGDVLRHLAEKIDERWSLGLKVAIVVRSCGGLTVGYKDLNKLGVDRWLAMLAAYEDAKGACVVVDCGTALTIDIVDKSGHHQGGYIVPGLKLSANALTEHTSIILPSTAPDYDLSLGHSTESAIYNGTIMTLVALIEKTILRELILLDETTKYRIYLTGGDAEQIARFLVLPIASTKLVPGLVFDGLSIALP